MIKSLFPTPVYETTLADNNLNEKLNIFSKEVETVDVMFPSSLYENGYTSYFNFSNLQCRDETRDLCLKIIQIAKTYCQMLGYDTSLVPLGITSLWVSRQGVGADHQLHNHRMSFISGTYYSSADDNSAKIYFQSPLEMFKMNWPIADIPNNYNSDDEFIQPDTGKLILFPSFLNHRVEKQIDSANRIAWSFNINLIRY